MDMKKIYPLLLLLLSALNFAACDIYVDDPYYDERGTDRSRASIISGQWKGDFGMFYSARHPHTGQWQQFDADYSHIIFYSDYYGARSGTGKQVDFYRYGPYEYQYHAFYWEVRGGTLLINYPHDPNLNVEIYDYSLTPYNFRGRINGSNFVFNLTKLSHWNRWNHFSGNYMFGEFDAWSWPSYNAPQRNLPGFTPKAAPSVGQRIVNGRRAGSPALQ